MSCELSVDQLAEIAIDVVRVGMAIALDPPCDLAVDTKSNRNDLVTAVDRAIEEEIAARLEEATGLPLLGEEGHAVDSFAGRVWVLDPIDGTMNYVETHRDYAVSLALCEDGEPVLGVVRTSSAATSVMRSEAGARGWMAFHCLARRMLPRIARRLLSRTSKRSLRCRGSRGHCKRAEDTDATAPLRWSASRLRAGVRVPSCTCGYPRGISRRRPLLRPSAGRWQRGWTVRPLTCATRVRSSWLLPASMPRWWRGS